MKLFEILGSDRTKYTSKLKPVDSLDRKSTGLLWWNYPKILFKSSSGVEIGVSA